MGMNVNQGWWHGLDGFTRSIIRGPAMMG
jgi:hypothetical protein